MRFRMRGLAGPLLAVVLAPGALAQPAPGEEEVEEVVVQATRTGRRVADEPIRVEVIVREEIEEKVLMAPGNISMLLSETGGLRVQVTSPTLGASNIRVLGLRGRYTQLLADGLPLFGGQASSLGLLQIPPTDLGQVEVIKGAASALYGPSALGGVINLVSRRPGPGAAGEVLANVTTRDGQDLTAYGEAPLAEGWRASLTGGAHRQSPQDLDDDGWVDMPAYERWTLRPRLFWTGVGGAKGFVTLGALDEQRRGGALAGRTTPDGLPFAQTQDTHRLDGGLTADLPLGGGRSAHLRASGVTQGHRHGFGALVEKDRDETLFAEGSVSGGADGTTWLAGLALQADRYRSKAFPAFDYSFTAPAVFLQVEHDATADLTLAGSARVDFHDRYGTRFSPRLSALYRPDPWSLRASLGRGFYAPTPFVEEIEAAGLSRLEPLGRLRAETADSASVDAGYARGPLEARLTLFGSNVRHAVRIEEVAAHRVRLVNAPGASRTRGLEALVRYRLGDLTLTGSYVHVDATEPDPDRPGRRVVPITPHHTAGVVAVWEKHGRGRIGFEAYYTGRQSLEDNPLRTRSRPYVEMGVLGELIVGKARLFVNLENLLDVRQTKYDPILRRVRAPDGRWTVDAWAPSDGFVANGGLKWRF